MIVMGRREMEKKLLIIMTKHQKIMKKLFALIAVAATFTACSEIEDYERISVFTVTGYSSAEPATRTSHGTPNANNIPYNWTKGDYIWLGNNKSKPISSDCALANFQFEGGTAVVGTGHIFYNMTGTDKTAKVLATQTADGNLGNDGDFGYAVLDEFNSFYLSHKTSYVWFNTTTTSAGMPKLSSITLTAAEGISIAGERVFNFINDEWATSVTNGSNAITLNFANGFALQSSYEGVMAAMVCLPAAVGGKELTITYTFEDGSTYTEKKTPSKDFTTGKTIRVSTEITKDDLKQDEPELPYELRVLTFEDEDAKFEPYYLDYAGREITTWSDLIDDPQYMGPLTYGNDQTDAMYTWWDEGNTELTHTFPDNWAYCFWGGGHAISNYWGEGFTNEDRDKHIAKYYGEDYVAENAGNDAMLGWFNIQLMTPVPAHSGNNFAVHFGYKDFASYVDNLPEISFADGEARVIDHMYVTNTNYTLNQLVCGVMSEAGNTFGGSWTGLNDDSWLKIVAYGFDDVDADAYAEPISEVEFYLVQGEDVVTDWQKWDLSGLGAVAKVRFNFLYSEDMGGKYGFTLPAYFAYDDIAVRFDK